NGSNRVRKADLATFTASTLVSGISSPAGITHLGSTVYFSDGHRIQSVPDTGGSATLVAGHITTTGDTDATGASARFNLPAGMCTNGTDLFVADFNNGKLKKVTTGGVVTTLASGLTQ